MNRTVISVSKKTSVFFLCPVIKLQEQGLSILKIKESRLSHRDDCFQNGHNAVIGVFLRALIITIFLTIIAPLFLTAQNGSPLSSDRLKKQYEKLIQDYDVPGLGVAIVSNDSIILQTGFGQLSINNTKKVDSNTLFGIASLSKTFTSALVARAVEDKKFTFETPVTGLLPWFKLYDPYVTSQVTIEDALSHRTGLSSFSGDLIWYGSTIPDSIIIYRMRHLKAKHGFRTHFGYSNIMYLVVGKILEEQYGMPYGELLDSLIFTPVGMKNTTTSYQAAMHHFNLAIPHVKKDEENVIQPYISWDNMKPAGGLFSNASDMSKYLQLWLNKGVFDKDTIIHPSEIEWLWSQETPTKLSWLDKRTAAPVNFKSYGMGWAMMDYNGYKVFYHSGGLDGMVCQMLVVPDKNIGAVFMANKTSALPLVLMYDLLDKWLGDGTKNYPGKTLALLKKVRSENQEVTADVDPDESSQQDFILGVYVDSLVGKAIIKKQNDTLVLNWTESTIFKGYLKQTDMLTFELVWPEIPSLPPGNVVFDVNGVGEIKGFSIDLPNPDLQFNELYFEKKN